MGVGFGHVVRCCDVIFLFGGNGGEEEGRIRLFGFRGDEVMC